MRRLTAASLSIAAMTLAGALFLHLAGIDALEERNAFQFFADSQTYHEIARGGLATFDSGIELVGVAVNFLGPLLLLFVAGENYYAMLVLNALMLAWAIASIARSLGLDPFRFLLVLVCNPLVLSSLLSVNKEMLSIVFLALLLRACVARSAGAWIAAAVVSLLVRWQLTLVLLTVAFVVGPLNPLRERRWTTIAAIVLGLSLLYVLLGETLAPIRVNFEFAAEDYEGSGLYESLNSLQNDGWYWAVFPVKAVHLLFGNGLRLDRLFHPDNIYNDVFQLLHSLALLLLFTALVRAGRAKVSNDLVYLSLLYIAIFAITPIYSPRYFLPVYVLWAAALCAPEFVRVFAGTARAPSRPRRRFVASSPALPPKR